MYEDTDRTESGGEKCLLCQMKKKKKALRAYRFIFASF